MRVTLAIRHLSVLTFATVVLAQDASGTPPPVGEPQSALTDAARTRFGDFGLLSGEPARLGDLFPFLKGLDLRFKTFETDTPGEIALGVEYELKKSLTRPRSDASFSLDFRAQGNVAFDQDVNPDDFLRTSLRMHWFGTTSVGQGTARTIALQEDGAACLIAASKFAPQFYRDFSAKAASYKTADEVRADPDWPKMEANFLSGYQHRLAPELIWNIDLDASLESNQDFSSRQPTLGLMVGGRLVSWNPDSVLSLMNVFDYPAALLRVLAGTTDSFIPDGEAWPTIVVGLDQVEAAEDETRSALTNDDNFLRFRLETGMKTTLLRVGAQTASLALGWRFYQELGAPDAIGAAELDQFSHFQAAFQMTNGWSVTYSAGRLPLDASDDSTFSLGFKTTF